MRRVCATGARAEAWCLLIHAAASLSLSECVRVHMYILNTQSIAPTLPRQTPFEDAGEPPSRHRLLPKGLRPRYHRRVGHLHHRRHHRITHIEQGQSH